MDFDYDDPPIVQPKPAPAPTSTGTESSTWNTVTNFFGFNGTTPVQSPTGTAKNWYPDKPDGKMYAPPGPTGTVAPPPVPVRKVVPKFEKVSLSAITPSKNLPSNVAWDLFSSEEVIVKAGEMGVIDTGIKINIEPTQYISLFPRPERVINDKLLLGINIIDHDYSGSIKIILYNFGSEDVEIKAHEKIAQFVLN